MIRSMCSFVCDRGCLRNIVILFNIYMDGVMYKSSAVAIKNVLKCFQHMERKHGRNLTKTLLIPELDGVRGMDKHKRK